MVASTASYSDDFKTDLGIGILLSLRRTNGWGYTQRRACNEVSASCCIQLRLPITVEDAAMILQISFVYPGQQCQGFDTPFSGTFYSWRRI